MSAFIRIPVHDVNSPRAPDEPRLINVAYIVCVQPHYEGGGHITLAYGIPDVRSRLTPDQIQAAILNTDACTIGKA